MTTIHILCKVGTGNTIHPLSQEVQYVGVDHKSSTPFVLLDSTIAERQRVLKSIAEQNGIDAHDLIWHLLVPARMVAY